MHPLAQSVLEFWFSKDAQPLWFAKSAEFDQKIRDQFGEVLESAAAGECADWRSEMLGRLAEIIVLDQFSRNIHRDTPKAFETDGMALVLAQEAIALPEFKSLNPDQRRFMLMPYMHSESKQIHEKAMTLFEQFTDATTVDYERQHKVIIDEFGRYPHRNAILGRPSTAQEQAFLKKPNTSF
ncbi:DUF924 family protein [Moraxella canis]|uniref:DUF924 family protein n=1 Tax=Moraxella canis TaxID=90239 RepID=A0ABZ0WVN4_9GAMM|nr:DUF924 family protein [Moraxella canis]WQE03225.1 DUF924 family protein [Moraxella canis]